MAWSGVNAGETAAYKLVKSDGTLAGFDVVTVSETGGVTIKTTGLYKGDAAAANLTPGTYDLYVWKQVTNANGFNFGSYPAKTTFTIQ